MTCWTYLKMLLQESSFLRHSVESTLRVQTSVMDDVDEAYALRSSGKWLKNA